MSGLFYEYRRLKLNITLRELSNITHGTIHGQDSTGVIDEVVYDSRLIQSGEGKVFFGNLGKGTILFQMPIKMEFAFLSSIRKPI